MSSPRWLPLSACFAALLLCSLPFSGAQYTSLGQQKNSFEGDDRTIDSVEQRAHNKVMNKTEIVLVVLMSTQNELPVYYELLKPSIELAVEYVNSRYSEFSIRVKARKDTNSCESNVVAAMAAEEYYVNQLNGIIGPICSKALDATARLASHWVGHLSVGSQVIFNRFLNF